jgi:hypothetical protein
MRAATATILMLMPVAVVACSQAHTSRLDDRTLRIEGTEVPGGSDVPNKRVAEQMCPRGYRVLDSQSFKPEPNSQMATNWTIRCL